MQKISRENLNLNSNSDYSLQGQIQEKLTNGNAQFVIDMAQQMRFGHSVSCIALHIANIFFHKRSYINFDRFMILTASILLASKLKDVDPRLKLLCSTFHRIIVSQNMINLPNIHGRSNHNSQVELYTESKWNKLKEQIVINESEILRTLQYETEFISPTEYIRKYCDLLYPDRQLNKKLFYGARMVVLDSYRTRASLVYSPLVIFCTSFLISCRYEKALPHETVIIKKIARERMAKSKEVDETGEMPSRTLSPRQRNQQSATPQLSQPRQSPSKSQAISTLSQPIKSQNIQEKVSKEFLYETWLEFVSCEEDQKVTSGDVLGCLEIIDGLLKLWGSQ